MLSPLTSAVASSGENSWSDDPTQKTDVKQVWFAGVHSDIGGGYDPETSQLSSVALLLDAGRGHRRRPQRGPDPVPQRNAAYEGLPPDLTADMHDSMTKGWKFAEWFPAICLDQRPDYKRHLPHRRHAALRQAAVTCPTVSPGNPCFREETPRRAPGISTTRTLSSLMTWSTTTRNHPAPNRFQVLSPAARRREDPNQARV